MTTSVNFVLSCDFSTRMDLLLINTLFMGFERCASGQIERL